METLKAQKEQATPSKKNNNGFFKPAVQKKLSVGSANDSYEIEADRVADKVMKMSEPSPQVTHSGALLQRKCAACEQEEKLQMKPLAETISPLIQRSSTENGGVAPNHVENQITSSKGGGNSMDHETKNFMGSRFGTDFSAVKIHTGNEAVQMSRELNAQAFAVGNDIYFNEGKYNPNSDKGKHLLAHELTHMIQQSGKINKKIIQKLGDTSTIPAGLSCAVPPSNTMQQTVYYFQNDNSTLTAEQQASLRSMAEVWVSSGSNIPVRIDGYASAAGEHNHNWTLSCLRAESVKNVLISNGVSQTMITAYMNGETNDFGNEEQNRRVNIYMNVPTHVPTPVDPYYHPVLGNNECDDPTYCTSYTTAAEIAAAKNYLLTTFIPILETTFGSDVGALWRSYLSRRRGDSLAPRIFSTLGNSIHDAFSTNWSIDSEVDRVLDLISTRLSRGYGNVTQPLDNFISASEKQLHTDFSNPFSIPGNIAGGIGSSDAGVDYRKITWGDVSFSITELPTGNRIVTIEAFVNFEVKDAIDFCPGQCGAILEQSLATIKMSRLEASGEAYDVPFIVRFPGPRNTKTVIV